MRCDLNDQATTLADLGLGTSGPRRPTQGQPAIQAKPAKLPRPLRVADSMKAARLGLLTYTYGISNILRLGRKLGEDALQSHVALEEHWGPFRWVRGAGFASGPLSLVCKGYRYV